MAPSSKSVKIVEPPSASSNGCTGSLFALLLNNETKDEGEEFLDYSFPAADPEMQAVLPMKGVLLASCGVMKAAVGQEATFFVFHSMDGSHSYKASLCRVESWILCVILPASVRDRVLRFFLKEACGLIALRHGRLSTLKGNFGQLDRIFKTLSNLWCSTMTGSDEHVDASNLYASLGMVFWSPLAMSWKEGIQERIGEWQSRWEATMLPHTAGHQPPLAHPEGFALFENHTLIATSLADSAFEACLRLCHLEGAWDSCLPNPSGTSVSSASPRLTNSSSRGPSSSAASSAGGSGVGADESCEVWCHSLFLQQDEAGPAVLPSHQYSIIQRGPWLLFMLWQMSSGHAAGVRQDTERDPPQSETVPLATLQSSGDPFGIDLCMELLLSLPAPAGCVGRGADSQAAMSTLGAARKRTKSTPNALVPGAPRSTQRKKSQFSLPSCPSWSSLVRQKGRNKPADAETAALYARPRSFFYTLKLQEARTEDASIARNLGRMREPWLATKDHLRDDQTLRCPELNHLTSARIPCDWSPWGMKALLDESCDLCALLHEHGSRRDSWSKCPSRTLTNHVLLGVLRGKTSLDKVWEECSDENLTEASCDEQPQRRTEAVALGSGESWRFQVGAPFSLSDISPLVSVGSLSGSGNSSAWVSISDLRPALDQSTASDHQPEPCRALVFVNEGEA